MIINIGLWFFLASLFTPKSSETRNLSHALWDDEDILAKLAKIAYPYS
jgi:hypothetical protein